MKNVSQYFSLFLWWDSSGWISLSGNETVLRPFILDNSVTGVSFLKCWTKRCFHNLWLRSAISSTIGVFSRLWWAHDGAPAHTSVDVSTSKIKYFRHKVIALHHPHGWPPRSPDLAPCDFFLWGYLKSKVYATAPLNLEDLKQRIISKWDAIKQTPQLVRRAIRDDT